MGSADIYLKQAVLGLSILLVLLLAGAAIFSLLSNDEPVVSPDLTVDEEPAAASRPYPGERLEIDDAEFPLTVGCIRDRSSEDDVYLVVIENRGETITDYLVSANLSDGAGASVQALARADELRPGEEREVVLLPEDEIAKPSACVINAVQGDRRVLLKER